MSLHNFENDFRKPAIEASEKMLEESGNIDPWDAEFSYCIPTGKGPTSVNLINWSVNIFLVTAFICFSCILIPLDLLLEQEGKSWELTKNISVVVLSLFFLYVASIIGPIFTKRNLGKRWQDIKSSDCIFQWTFTKISNSSKQNIWYPDDIGFLLVDKLNRRIYFEGIVCRFLILDKDTNNLIPASDALFPDPEINFCIGKEKLSIKLFYTSIKYNFSRLR